MKRVALFVVALACWLLPSPAAALPLCGGVTDVTTYNSGGGCTIDGLVFSEFLVVPALPGSPDDVYAVSSLVIGSTVYFVMNPNLGVGDTAEDIYFYFKVATLSGTPGIFGVDLFNAGGGSTAITEGVCTAPWLANICHPYVNGGILLTTLAAGSGQYDIDYFDPVSAAYIFKDISVGAGSSHMSSFTQSFHVVPDSGSTIALLGTALCGLALLQRRRVEGVTRGNNVKASTRPPSRTRIQRAALPAGF